jgi:hypothetical protein
VKKGDPPGSPFFVAVLFACVIAVEDIAVAAEAAFLSSTGT